VGTVIEFEKGIMDLVERLVSKEVNNWCLNSN